MHKVIISLLAVLITNSAFALNAEYKNTLNKINLNKSSDSLYTIDLYTQKEFKEPVKIIKKSDLSYYILLPETNNTIQNSQISNSDIRSVSTQIFPYAGADVKNGYTKININTTKPFSFKINTKVALSTKPEPVAIKEQERKEVKTAAIEPKVQKKNLLQESQKSKDNYLTDKNSKTVNKPTLVSKQEIKNLKKPAAAAKISLNEQIKKPSVEEKIKKVEQKTEAEKEIQTKQEPLAENIQEETEIQEENIQEQIQQETQKQIEPAQTNNITATNNSINLSKIKDDLTKKLQEYGLSLREFLLMAFAGILSFIIMLLILTRGGETETRLKSKADFIDKNSNKTSSLVAKKDFQNNKSDNQYFVFDNNVRQTGFIAPASSNGKNYELSSYKPTVQKDSATKVEPYQSRHVKSEYDIIQNILKEDAFIEISDNDINNPKEQTNPLKSSAAEVQETIIQAPQTTQKMSKDEPEILSSVEIAPKRGFMCVSYNNSISLVGYIFDDVFALYNFKQQKLENYAIKFRLSEKTANGANFIVRIDKSKMLISVTKSSMNLEVAF